MSSRCFQSPAAVTKLHCIFDTLSDGLGAAFDRRRFLSALLCVLLGAWSAGAEPTYRELDFSMNVIPEAVPFELRDPFSGTRIRGLRMGDFASPVIVFTGGYGSNILAYRLWMRSWVREGFQVIAYNSPGFGQKALASASLAGETLDLNRQVWAMETMIRFAYRQSRRPVVVAGHSFGGMQARFVTLGLRSADGRDYIDEAVRREMRERIALVVPMLSPSPVLVEDVNWEQRVQMDISVFALGRVAPSFVSAYRFAPEWLRRIHAFNHSTVYRMLGDRLDSVLAPLFGSPDMDADEYRKVFPHAISDGVPAFLPAQLRRWTQQLKVTSGDGRLDLGEAWLEQQTSGQGPLVLMVIGEKDRIADARALLAESQILPGTKALLLESGHMGAMISPSQAEMISEAIQRRAEFGSVAVAGASYRCTQLF
jgi:pimeloyl-ACP methyl ester carboxylesterase